VAQCPPANWCCHIAFAFAIGSNDASPANYGAPWHPITSLQPIMACLITIKTPVRHCIKPFSR
jgi:hypothetical protein